MKRRRFGPEKIIGVLMEHQTRLSTAELCRKHGISDATFNNCRSKFGVSEAKLLKQIEYAKQKELLTQWVIQVWTLREMFEKLMRPR